MGSGSIRFASVATFTLGSALALTLAACGGGGGGGGPSGHAAPAPDFKGCADNPTLGASAIMSYSQRTEWVKSDFFGKPYNRYDLEAVLDASTTSTTEYVKSLGISLYKITTGPASKNCPTYFNLPDATEALQLVWAEADGGGADGGSLQGLHFENCGRGTGKGCKERVLVDPTIIVMHASNRHTLVHELMHHNFNHGEKADMDRPTRSLLSRMMKSYEAGVAQYLKAYSELPNRGDLMKLLDEVKNLAKVGNELVVRGPLEEVAIEGMLIDLWAKGEFKNTGRTEPSTWYMTVSREKALGTNADVKPILAMIVKEAQERFWPEIEAEANLVAPELDRVLNESAQMIKDADAKIARALGRSLAGQPGADGQTGAPGQPGTGEPVTVESGPPTTGTETLGIVAVDPENTVQREQTREEIYRHIDSLDRDGLGRQYRDMMRKLRKDLQLVTKSRQSGR